MTTTPGQQFAQRLRQRRRLEGLTQAELARRLSEQLSAPMDATAITKIEKGLRPVRLDEAIFIARVLEVPLAALVSDQDPMDIRLGELRQRIREQESRVAAAEHEIRQAQMDIISAEQEIAAIEASRTP